MRVRGGGGGGGGRFAAEWAVAYQDVRSGRIPRVEIGKLGWFVDGWTGGELGRWVVFGRATGKYLVACRHGNS